LKVIGTINTQMANGKNWEITFKHGLAISISEQRAQNLRNRFHTTFYNHLFRYIQDERERERERERFRAARRQCGVS